jgi:hypothetical protein
MFFMNQFVISYLYQRSYPISSPFAQPLQCSAKQRAVLEKNFIDRHLCPQQLVPRAHIILLAADGSTNTAIAAQVGRTEKVVSEWRSRWADAFPAIATAEAGGHTADLEALIQTVLSDRPRSGAPLTYTAEQVCQIIAVSRENPQHSGHPVSHWTPDILQVEVNNRGIAPGISPRTIGRIWEEAALKPHQMRTWEYPGRTDDPQFQQEVRVVCQTYAAASILAEQGIHTICVDEKTAIQALGCPYPTLPMKSGQPERQEFTYIRHGTLTLITDLDVVTGHVLASIGPTRTEEDFLAHIKNTVALDPLAGWVFVSDQLNIHKSEGLVQFVTQQCQLSLDLGTKGISGILADMESRAAFLSDSSHRIRFVYTPKHASWLNQVEIWFSILVRRLLKRLRCNSVNELKEHLANFVRYFNKTMAKPFKWTYKGKPLTV